MGMRFVEFAEWARLLEGATVLKAEGVPGTSEDERWPDAGVRIRTDRGAFSTSVANDDNLVYETDAPPALQFSDGFSRPEAVKIGIGTGGTDRLIRRTPDDRIIDTRWFTVGGAAGIWLSVVAVAVRGDDGDWAAYVMPVPSHLPERTAADLAADDGAKLPEEAARGLFPGVVLRYRP
jgi:hypothetical protein